jgi:hypothetical protein
MPFIPIVTPPVRELGNFGATGGAGTIPTYNYYSELRQMSTAQQFIAWSLSAPSSSEVDVGSLMSVLTAQAQAINDMATMQSDMLTAHQSIATNLTVIASVLSGISGQMSTVVTTQVMAVADQINNNKFQQVTTNAALKRSDLPETVVPTDSLAKTFQDTATSVTSFKAQVSAANLVQDGINESFKYGQTLATQYLKDSFIGTWGDNVKTFFKGFINSSPSEIATEAKKEVLQVNASKRGTKLLYVPPPQVF